VTQGATSRTSQACRFRSRLDRKRWDADSILRDAVLYQMLLGEIASALRADFSQDGGPPYSPAKMMS
jgi:hypothetical protein